MQKRRFLLLLPLVASLALAPDALAQNDRLKQLEERVQSLEQNIQRDHAPSDKTRWDYVVPLIPFPLILALFCALWARTTGRDFWLWFVAGLLFNLFALIVLAVKHRQDRAAERAAVNEGRNDLLNPE